MVPLALHTAYTRLSESSVLQHMSLSPLLGAAFRQPTLGNPVFWHYRPANSALVTAASSGVELPAPLQGSAEAVSEQFYLATMREPTALPSYASMQRRGSLANHAWQEEQNQALPAVQQSLMEPEPFTAVNLGPLLGSGGSGHVYRGTWNGATVAVKVSMT